MKLLRSFRVLTRLIHRLRLFLQTLFRPDAAARPRAPLPPPGAEGLLPESDEEWDNEEEWDGAAAAEAGQPEFEHVPAEWQQEWAAMRAGTPATGRNAADEQWDAPD